jgi:hypothetical protein
LLGVIDVEATEVDFEFDGALAMPIMISTTNPIPIQWITLSFFSLAPQ